MDIYMMQSGQNTMKKKTKDEVIEMPIQVNGKVRGGTIKVNIDDTQDIVREKALKDENIKRYIEEKKYS